MRAGISKPVVCVVSKITPGVIAGVDVENGSTNGRR